MLSFSADFLWNNMVKELKTIVGSVTEEYGISKDRIVFTGSGMEGYGKKKHFLLGKCFFLRS